MKNFYDRPTLKIQYWLVTKADLKKIYDFFLRRYNILHTEVNLETASGNNKIYDSFEEFVDDVDHIIESRESVEIIDISHSAQMESGRTRIRMSIDFKRNEARFYLSGEGEDVKIKDWIDGSYEEMQRIVKAVELTDETLIKALKKKFGNELTIFIDSVIVFDPNAEIKESLKTETATDVATTLTPIRTHWHTTWWGMLIIGTASILLGTLILRWIGII